MGRPSQCNPCCGGDPPDPPIGDCENVICVAFIDENDSGINTFEDKMAKWIIAYPDRLLFVLDVFRTNNFVVYPQNFLQNDHSFSLRDEFLKSGGPTPLIEFMARDNGDTGIANSNDPWERIKTIVNHYGGDILSDFNLATEVSIFVDDSGSMSEEQVAATVSKLESDAITDGYSIVNSIANSNEDVICPFVQLQCCTGTSAGELMEMCGIDNKCNPADSITFNTSPDNGLIWEYCDFVWLPDSPFFDVCNTCITPTEENEDQSIEYRAIVTNDLGQNLEYVEVDYEVEYFNEITQLWTAFEQLDNDFSNELQSTSVLTDDWRDGPPCDHKWLQENSACNSYTDYVFGQDCIKRIFNRRFRIKGTTIGYGNLVAYSNEFKLFEWRKEAPVGTGDWVQIGPDIDGDNTFDYFGESVSVNVVSQYLSRPFVAAGAPQAQGFFGYVEAYQWIPPLGQWLTFGQRLYGDTTMQNFGSSISMYNGQYLAVGDPDGDGGGIVRVYFFQFDGVAFPHSIIIGDWVQLGSDITPGGNAGQSVAVTYDAENSRPSVAIGCPNAGGGGKVEVYDYIGGVWTLRGNHQIPNALLFPHPLPGRFGYSVDFSEDSNRVVAGAYLNDTANPLSGGIGVYEWDQDANDLNPDVGWTVLGSEILGQVSSEAFGFSVAIDADGNVVCAGVRYSNAGGSNSGACRTYSYQGGSWSQRGSDIAGSTLGVDFGFSIDMNDAGNMFIGGEPSGPGGILGASEGQGRPLQWNGSAWSGKGSPIVGEAAFDYSAYSVSSDSSGDIVAIGARSNDANGNSSGHVRVWQWVPQ